MGWVLLTFDNWSEVAKLTLPWQNSVAVGAFVAPFISQSLIAREIPWQNFYLGSLVLSALNIVFITLSFRPAPLERAEEIRENSVDPENSAESKEKLPDTPIDEKDVVLTELNSLPKCESGLPANVAPNTQKPSKSSLCSYRLETDSYKLFAIR